MAVKKKRNPEDLSIEELRQLIINKRRDEHNKRYSRTRRSGNKNQAEILAGEAPEDQNPAAITDQFDEELSPSKRRKRSGFDRILVGVEVLAVAGLLFILFNVFGSLRMLNQEVAAAIIQPTITPTAILQAVVLPSGHTPPTDPGGVRFNESEIPEHLRAYVQALAQIPIPTSSPEQAIRIQIPAISVDAPIVMGDGEEQLKKGVGQSIGTANPGQNGNLVLSAHNDVYGEIFRDLDKLSNGDQIIIYTQVRSYTYVVEKQQIVEPTQVEVMAPTEDPSATLISCYPYLVDKQRIVISASLLTQ